MRDKLTDRTSSGVCCRPPAFSYIMGLVEKFTYFCGWNKNLSKVERCIQKDATVVNKKNSDGYTGLMLAAKKSNKTFIVNRILSTPNIDIGIRGNHGKSALHYCCYNNNIDSLRLLLQHPSCTPKFVNMKNRKGKTAEMLAKNNGFRECVKLIQDYLKSIKSEDSASSAKIRSNPSLDIKAVDHSGSKKNMNRRRSQGH